MTPLLDHGDPNDLAVARRDLCPRGVVRRRRRGDRRSRGSAGLPAPLARRSAASRATRRGPARGARRPRRAAPRPVRRRGARQRRLRDLGRSWRHGHVGRSPPRPAGRASPRTDTRPDRPAHRSHRTDRRRSPRRRVEGLRGPSTCRGRRCRPLDPPLPHRARERSTNSRVRTARRCSTTSWRRVATCWSPAPPRRARRRCCRRCCPPPRRRACPRDRGHL